MQSILLKLLPYAVAVLMVAGGVYYVYHSGYSEGEQDVQARWDKEKAEQMAADLQATLANEKLKTDLETTKNANLDYVSRVYFELGKSQRLRLPKTPCNTATTTTGSDSAAGSGVVSTAPEAGQDETDGGVAQQGFDEYERGRNDEAYRADAVVEGCRVLNDWSRSMATKK